MEVNLLPLFIGTGFGTASIANGLFLPEHHLSGGAVLNPHANIIRIAFEAGAIGLLVFVAAFTRPLKYLKLSKQDHNQLMLFMCLILGANFGHRSSTLYIFLGLVLLIFNYKNNIEVKKI
jgi:O-antigen ligase